MRRVNDCRIFRKPILKSLKTSGTEDPLRLKTIFEKYGYVTIANVISKQQVEELRAYLERFFTSGKELNTREFFLNSILYNIPFNDRVIGFLKVLLGQEIVLYPNFTVRKNLFTDWHIDGAFVGKDPVLQSNNFKHVQCALYLQRNSAEVGGGLDVVPFSHNLLFRKIKNTNTVSNWLVNLRNVLYKPVSIDYNLGDLIIFHSRLIHRGTQIRKDIKNNGLANPGMSKYGIFWSASKSDDDHIKRHMNYFKSTYTESVQSNDDNKNLDTLEQFKIIKTQMRFKNIIGFKFPDDYPTDIKDVVVKNKIRVASLADIGM
jgi:hypothetical protein